MSRIFHSDNLDVRLFSAPGNSGLLIYFPAYEPVPDAEQALASAGFLTGLGVDVAIVVPKSNRWFQYPEMAACRATLARIGAGYRSRMTYGISMGGYEAIKSAAELGCCRVLAVSPQYSIDAAKVPFEVRWRREADNIRFIDDDLRMAPGIAYYVVSDPFEAGDAHHLRLIKATGGDMRHIPVPFGTHFVAHMLIETGQAAPLLRDFVSDRLQPNAARQRLRAARSGSITYVAELLRRLETRQAKRPGSGCPMAPQLMQRISTLDSDIARNQYGKSLVLLRMEQHEAALTAAWHAVRLKPEHPLFRRHFETLRTRSEKPTR